MSIRNKLYTGDCLHIVHGLDSESIDLIYLDPPFNSKRIFSAPVGSLAAGNSFEDMWTWDDVDKEYLEQLIDDYPFMVNLIQTLDVIHSKSMKSYVTYMAQRIIELERVLKKTGSFYLHCDSTAAHYLKIVCDRVFGKNNFRNEITWKRFSAHSDSKYNYGRITDSILFYTKSDKFFFNPERVDHSDEYLSKEWRKLPSGRLYKTENLLDPPQKMKEYNFHGTIARWRMTPEKLEGLWSAPQTEVPQSHGRIKINKNGNPLKRARIIFYDELLEKNKGVPVQDLWNDISYLAGGSKESTGYPTQKPLKLLKRIIQSSSKEGDIVLDPFCGCATTCVAAQQLDRSWVGIDISKTSSKIVMQRLSDDAGIFTNYDHFDCLKDESLYPKRNDIEIVKKDDVKERLFKEQDGKCNACKEELSIKNFEVDHIIPRSKNGADTYENFQLLCPSCNKIKGNRPMAYLMMRIKQVLDAQKFVVSFGEGD